MFVLASSPLIDAYISSDGFGKLIFISLFILSIISWVILVNKSLMIKSIRKSSQQVLSRFEEEKHNPLNINFEEDGANTPFLKIYQIFKKSSLEILNKNQWFLEHKHNASQEVYLSASDVHLVDVQLSVSVSEEVQKIGKHLFILPMIVSLSPFLGLLGTVWGILLTFSELQVSTHGASNQVVLGGLSMALATTVLGLVVAIPALIAYNMIKNSLKNYEIEMETFTQQLLTAVEMQYRKVEISIPVQT
jgi:biopolymer transport protein TolQ